MRFSPPRWLRGVTCVGRRSAVVRAGAHGRSGLDRHRRDQRDERHRAEGARLSAERREPVGADHVSGLEERADRRVSRQLDARAGAAREAVRRREVDRRGAAEPVQRQVHARRAGLRGGGGRAFVRGPREERRTSSTTASTASSRARRRTRTSRRWSTTRPSASATGSWSNRARPPCSRKSSARCATRSGSCFSRGSRI